MARIDTLNNYLTDISSAIKQKRNITENIQAKNFDEEILKISEDSGININGILKEYKVKKQGRIDIGDFVSYVNGLFNSGNDNEINTSYSAFGQQYKLQATELTENRLLILDGNPEDANIIGMICHIENENIIIDNTTILVSTLYSVYNFSMAKLSNNRVFVTYINGNFTHGIVVEINENSLSVLSNQQISSNFYARYNTVTKISLSKVLITYSYGSYFYLYGLICTIADNGTISMGAAMKLTYSDGYRAAERIDPIIKRISDTRFTIFYLYSTANGSTGNKFLGTAIYDINESTNALSMICHNENKNRAFQYNNLSIDVGEYIVGKSYFVFIYSYNIMYMVPCIFDEQNNIITFGTYEAQFGANSSYESCVKAYVFDNKYLLLFNETLSNKILNTRIYNIKSTEILQLDSSNDLRQDCNRFLCLIELSQNRLLLLYKDGAYGKTTKGFIISDFGTIETCDGTSEILGVAKISGRDGAIIQVYTPLTRKEIEYRNSLVYMNATVGDNIIE